MRIWFIHGLFLLLILPVGCRGDVSASHRIDSGVDPRYQDNDVRFRTTYYFRVFDVCDVLDEDRRDDDYGPVGNTFTKRQKGTYKILNDSLYRFRMTGKASAMFQNIIFESGTLRAEQIDPFGSTIDYDDATRKFAVHSATENKQAERRTDVYNEVQRLYDLRSRVPGDHPEGKTKIEDLVVQQLESLGAKSDRGKNVSVIVATAAAKESVMQIAQRIGSEEDISEAQKKIMKDLGSGLSLDEKDPLVKSAGDLTQGLIGVIGVFEALVAQIDKAIEEQKKKAESAAGDVDKAITPRDEAAQGVMNAKTDSKIPELPDKQITSNSFDLDQQASDAKAKAKENVKVGSLEKANKKLEEESEVLKGRSANLKLIEDAITRLKKHKRRVETERDRVRRAMNLVQRAPGTKGLSNYPFQARGTSDANCADGKPSRRGFQVLGPEGFKSFDQDERLVMALSIDSKPLIGTLQQFSDQRFIAEKVPGIASGSTMKLEQMRIRSARNVLADFEKTLNDPKSQQSASDLVDYLVEAFNSKKSNSSPAFEPRVPSQKTPPNGTEQ